MPRLAGLLILAGVALAALRPRPTRPLVGFFGTLSPAERARALGPAGPNPV